MSPGKLVFCFPLLIFLFIFADCGDIHGGVKMGVSNNMCDNAKDHLSVDWDNSTNADYTCLRNEKYIPVYESEPVTDCLPRDSSFPRPLHKCMGERITYDDPPPRAGSHRPLWPVYGRYLYVPPQRWIHSLEHGAAVFLYHPCGDYVQISKLIAIAKSCLRRYIITPYKVMPINQPYAVVTYGCRLMMSSVNEEAVKYFIKAHAIKDGPEKVPRDGQYSYGLQEKSEVVTNSDFEDSNLCPSQTSSNHDLQLDDGIDNMLPFTK